MFCNEKEVLGNKEMSRPKISPPSKMMSGLCISQNPFLYVYQEGLYGEQEGRGSILGSHDFLSLKMFHFISQM